jgi:predicted enzyme related to lactoylglutathione lyase
MSFQWLQNALAASLAALMAAMACASPLGPDGVAGGYHPGKFTWFELATEDPAGAQAFYGAVFGWRFKPIEGALPSYALILSGDAKVGGMFRHARPQGASVGARWIGMMSLPDPAAAARYVQQQGGKILAAPSQLPGRGDYAVFRDPQGAVFAVLRASEGDPPDDPVEEGDFFWADLFSPQPEASAAFYAGLAGYEVTHGDVGWERKRWGLSAGGFARAGIVALGAGKTGPGWLPYVLVGDVPATLERVRRAGGRVVVRPRADLLDGNVAVIVDPLGGVVGIVDWPVRAGASKR